MAYLKEEIFNTFRGTALRQATQENSGMLSVPLEVYFLRIVFPTLHRSCRNRQYICSRCSGQIRRFLCRVCSLRLPVTHHRINRPSHCAMYGSGSILFLIRTSLSCGFFTALRKFFLLLLNLFSGILQCLRTTMDDFKLNECFVDSFRPIEISPLNRLFKYLTRSVNVVSATIQT